MREQAARTMFKLRFPDEVSTAVRESSIERLRGVEGARMRAVYATHAKRNRIRSWKRVNGHAAPIPDGPVGAVNRALNSGNSALYGVVGAVVASLGLSPGHGVIHTGNRQSFVLDIADLYKAEVTIPLAFRLRDSDDPETDMLRALRQQMRLVRLIPRIVDDTREVLGGGDRHDEDDWLIDELYLWGREGLVSANWQQPMIG